MTERRPFTVHCGDCSHQWIVAYLPMLVEDFMKIAGKPHCPMCASGNVLCGASDKEEEMPIETNPGIHETAKDPTRDELNDPRFEAIWQVIKGWDVSTREGLYEGANGAHVAMILRALNAHDTSAPGTPIERAAYQGIRNAQRQDHKPENRAQENGKRY
ncbi:hypothetical protein [Fodinicurvata sediminis]|uniref:hypothetical protein n=1 Tax=Fodinicurvata sediminis TaxID=1121832 RepID=UPI0003B551B8|nr:hypothetical protein [Fodinicurvata sediminis]